MLRMSQSIAPTYPRILVLKTGTAELRYMTARDEATVLAFARALPPHDLLFLPRDITHPKVVAAWVAAIERGAMTTLLAVRDGSIVGCATLANDPLSWSPHVGELRAVVAVAERGLGLGRALLEDVFALALDMGLEKVVAHMTADQTRAIAIFEAMGYRREALLQDHVGDRDGTKHDVVILSHDLAAFSARMSAYGRSQSAGE